jgi:hypothetical protein
MGYGDPPGAKKFSPSPPLINCNSDASKALARGRQGRRGAAARGKRLRSLMVKSIVPQLLLFRKENLGRHLRG